MNRVSRALMSGASLAALTLGSVDLTRAAGITVNAATNAVTVTNAQHEDFIVVTGTGSVTNDITNDGTIGISAGGITVQNGGSVGGSIINAGHINATQVGISVGNSALVGGNITNAASGAITVTGHALSGTILVGIDAGNGLTGSIQNSGTVKVIATGISNAAVGVFNSGHEVNLSNDGTIEVLGSGDSLEYFGVEQFADPVTPATAAITNAKGALIQVVVTSAASSSANAAIKTAVLQHVSSVGSAATDSLTNNGSIFVAAIANADVVVETTASANANVTAGILQTAKGTGSGLVASASFVNAGSAVVNAVAIANGTSATAKATIGDGVRQNVSAVNTASGVGDASATVTNSGALAVHVNATAIAFTSAAATAKIVAGASQQVHGGDHGAASLANSGTFEIIANASAQAFTGSAHAEARITHGIEQLVTGGGARLAATAAVTNSATMMIEASAIAHGHSRADADVSLARGVSQGESGAIAAKVTLDNSGTLSVESLAHAVAATGAGTAFAHISRGFYQQESSAGSTGSESATISNSGTVDITAIANAIGATHAQASASIFQGAAQNLSGADVLSASLVNNASLAISAIAGASATLKSALASAGIHSGIEQTAIGISGAHTATASLTNSGTLGIKAVAHATGATSAAAAASVSHGVSQVAQEAGASSVSLTNSGTLDILAQATAHGRIASASAGMETGIEQKAVADASAGSTATATLSNTGALATIDIHALAVATGGIATATVSIEGIGIAQKVSNADSASATLTNSGSISVVGQAIAHAPSGLAAATVEMASGIFQSAHAAGNEVASTDTLTNSGTIAIEGLASATGGLAHASVRMITGISQDAELGATSSATLTNSGTMTILAQATAKATGGGGATAEIRTGIYQFVEASGDSTATASVSNSATLDIEAIAKVTAALQADANATISDTGIFQEAQNADSSSTSVTNSGTLSIIAQANAKATAHNATAFASIDHGISQEAFASGLQVSAAAALSNSSTLNIESLAKATGGTDAAATASLYHAIVQSVEGGKASTATLTNTGTMTLIAQATAKAGDFASAHAFVSKGISQFVSASSVAASTATATVTNSSTMNIEVLAKANGLTGASAAAIIKDSGILQEAAAADTSSSSLTNSGSITIIAQATAKGGTGDAFATGFIGWGVVQEAFATNTDHSASVTLNNSGTVNIEALAKATGGGATASAGMFLGISQTADNGVQSTATLVNSATLNVIAQATAKAGAAGLASAFVETGIFQRVSADGSANSASLASLTNSATLRIAAKGSEAGSAGRAFGFVTDGIAQHAVEGTTDTDTLNNSGTLTISAAALAKDTHLARAFAEVGGSASRSRSTSGSAALPAGAFVHDHVIGFSSIGGGIAQTAFGNGANGVASVSLTNSGTLNILANATASGSGAEAQALNLGVLQFASAQKGTSVTLTNSGTINIDASAKATAAKHASAFAEVVGMIDLSAGPNASISLVNSGTLAVQANANAQAGTTAGALGLAVGADEFLPGGGTAGFTNSGTFDVESHTSITAPHGGSLAEAVGLVIGPPIGLFLLDQPAALPPATALAVNVLNGGTYTVAARQAAPVGSAAAFGMVVESGVPISGTVENDGTMRVTATGANADALGVVVIGPEFTGSIVNKGRMVVAATAPAGHIAHASGIVVGSTSFTSSSSAHGILHGGTVVNNGKLWVGQSSRGNAGERTAAPVAGTIINDGGTIIVQDNVAGTTTRGVAINVVNSSNPIAIQLKGTNADGHIYGDILMANADSLTVSSGRTFFDGVVNNPAHLAGALSISADGTLEFVNNLAEGPAHAYANTFTQAGTLELQINPTPVAVAPTATTTAGFIAANSATLGGTILIDPVPGIYAEHTTYQVVFSSAPISGTWSNVETTGGSALLQPQAVYTTNEADIVLTRIAFDEVPGLTPNQEAVADGLEGAYGDTPPPPLKTLLGDLLTLDKTDYKTALDLLGDPEDGELALFTIEGVEKFLQTLSNHIAGFGTGGMAANVGPARVMPAQLTPIQFGSGQVWGSLYGSWSNIDSTISGPKASGSQNGMAVGLDVPVDNNTMVGGALNYAAGTLKIDGGRAHGSYSGFSAALYGRYDDDAEPWYVTANGSFGGYADRSRRLVSVAGPAGGAGIFSGRFFSRVWSLYGEAGYEVARDANFSVTPYFALELLNGNSGAYTSSETTILSGSPLPSLSVSSVSATSVDSRLGATIATDLEIGDTTVLPSLKIAWLHEFNDNPWIVNALFSGVPTSAFRITGAGLSSDFLDLDAGITMKLEDRLNALIDYEGRISSDRQDHALVGRLVVKL